MHQGYELYGSDRSLVDAVEATLLAWPTASINVVLPKEGPLSKLLRNNGVQVIIEPVWVLRKKHLARLIAVEIFRLPRAIVRAVNRMRMADITYVNTSVVVDYLLAGAFYRGILVAHVHELPQTAVSFFLALLLRASRSSVICNSNATRDQFAKFGVSTSFVVHNGVPDPGDVELPAFEHDRRIRILMIGRISTLKGQDILVDAIASLPEEVAKQFDVRIIGGTFDNSGKDIELLRKIDALGVDNISVEPFTDDTGDAYKWSDLVVVPSRKPESFGRVAVEAMSYGRPVIAASHGGLTEIVSDGTTGWLVEPGSVVSLANVLRVLVERPGGIGERGAAAREVFRRRFERGSISAALISALSKIYAEGGKSVGK